MFFVHNTCTDPHFNLALDEYLLTQKKDDYFTLWRNEPSVIIGRNQDALAEINFDFLRSHGIHLVRRMSGGGAVFHDLGNINFTYITPCEKRDFFNFQRFAAPILAALQSLGIDAQATGRNDLTIDGKKFSGNAQHLLHGRILHHGTMLFDSDFSYMQGALNVSPDKLRGKGVSSVRSRVTNISAHCPQPMTTGEFLEYMERYILQYFPDITPYNLTAEDIAAVNKLADSKYRTDDWNLRHMGNYTYRKSGRFPSGGIEVAMTVKGGTLTDIHFSGDFFGIMDIAALEDKLVGLPHDPTALQQALEEADLSDYISGVTVQQLLSLFF